MHATHGERNIVERQCASCGLSNVVDESGTCADCNHGHKIISERLVKQKRVGAVLAEAGIVPVSVDRVVDSSCNKRRPDFLIDAGTHFVVVECDEHQHRGSACETRRMFEIAQALGLPTVFVRYNPDAYKTAGGTRGNASAAAREKCLARWARHYTKAGTAPAGAQVSALWLYYDGWTALSDRKPATPLEITELGDEVAGPAIPSDVADIATDAADGADGEDDADVAPIDHTVPGPNGAAAAD